METTRLLRPLALEVSDAGAADRLYDSFSAYAGRLGLSLYPHQDEAIIELLGGSHVVLTTPTGSGKSLVATAAIHAALSTDRVSFYTAPVKALVSEKFFELVAIFGADNVGMLTGDAAVNAGAPIIVCTAEVLANIALREGPAADVGLVVMDEFHYYGEFDRGWAWQVPLIELTGAQFVLMSATLGDMTGIAADLEARTGRDVAIVAEAERPVPLTFRYAMTPLEETLDELVQTHQAPVYVVHFTQAAAVEHALSLLTKGVVQKAHRAGPGTRAGLADDPLHGFRFAAGFGKTLSKLLKAGIGVHHAGMLPKYRRLVEQLAQQGRLSVICGTDTLGVGINVPIRTVLFTGLAKFDGSRQRVLRTREFLQIAGRAGRAGFDTAGYVVVQAPEHVIDNERAKAKAAAKNAAMSEAKLAKRKSKAQLKKAPEGAVVWSEQTFDRLVAGQPERLLSRMKVDDAMLINVLSRDDDAFVVLRRLLTDNHEDRRSQLRLVRRALRLVRSLVRSGVLTRLEVPDEFGRRYVLTVELPSDFALNQPLASFALAALDLLDAESPNYSLDVTSVIEAVLDAPMPVLFAQQHAARGDEIGRLKADGVDYEERMAIVESITWPKPLAQLLDAAYETYRQTHPWLPPDALQPKSIVREMWEQAMSFTDLVRRYQVARSEGLVLRYLTDAYRTLQRTVPDAHRSPELEDVIDWLGETIRQTDSSLLDEWQALTDPEHPPRDVVDHAAPPPPRPLSKQGRPFEVLIRNAMWARVTAFAHDDPDALSRLEREAAGRVEPEREVLMTRRRWDAALDDYYAEHDEVLLDAEARGPSYLAQGPEQTGEPVGTTGVTARIRPVRQTLRDPDDNRDWVLDAVVDCDATDEAGELVLAVSALHRLDG
ncbi:DEAD/DEAH box helicase [Micropruina sp.]|uniref:DEAD/DEAH box helicase n=1 Tax=Micropruina sp. TaxID=2737536 RepID=UPI0039E41FDD